MFLIESNQLLMKNNSLDLNHLESYIECQELLNENQIFLMKIKESAMIAEHYSIVKEDINILNEGIKEVIDKILDAIKNFLTVIWEKIKEYFTRFKNYLGFGEKQAEKIIKDIEEEVKNGAPEKEAEINDTQKINDEIKKSEEIIKDINNASKKVKQSTVNFSESQQEIIDIFNTIDRKIVDINFTANKIKVTNNDAKGLSGIRDNLTRCKNLVLEIDAEEKNIKETIEAIEKAIKIAKVRSQSNPEEFSKIIPMYQKYLGYLQKFSKDLLNVSKSITWVHQDLIKKLNALKTNKKQKP